MSKKSPRYRVEVFCLNCKKSYVTRLINKKNPNVCKYCGSIKIVPTKIWVVE